MIIKVKWRSSEREVSTPPGVKLSYLLMKENIHFPLPCGGEGICGQCKVKFHKAPPPPTAVEQRILSVHEISQGIRLACRVLITEETVIELLENPAWSVSNPSIQWQYLHPLVKGDPPKPGTKVGAIDLGTTTMALSILDTKERKRESLKILPNPQSLWGSDVVSRIKAGMENWEDKMAQAVWDTVTPHLNKVAFTIISGNSVMESIMAGYPLDSLSRYPFEPPFFEGEWRQNPIPHYLMPLVGKFMGGDASSLLLTLDLIGPNIPAVALDLGTNAEVIHWTRDGVWAASAPAGPAFEGVGISSGSGFSPGAVVRVERKENNLTYETVKGESAKGFCGSGLISLIALLLVEGVIDSTGRIKPPEELPHFWKRKRYEKGLLLDHRLTLTQEDVRKIQLAKGAVASILTLLLSKGNDTPFSLYLAGAFGSSLNPKDLTTLGIVPENTKNVIILGNTSLLGAEAVALSKDCLERVETLARRVTLLEPVDDPMYQKIYMDSLTFPEYSPR
jgi:uncharacterized 2Fe-2S/4Fe-4S cluster protein (DUF4445 family)